jgi:poly(hydroxyalkanoate) depolymerase family esterase
MKDFRNIDMKEVTRLTREGRLTQAMAVLRGDLKSAATGANQDRTTQASQALERASTQDNTARPSRSGKAFQPEFAPQQTILEALRGAIGSLGERGPLHGLEGLDFRRARRAPPPLPDGARFDQRVFSNEAGSRAYKLYTPGAHTEGPLPLVLMLHGCTQSPDDFAAGTRMNELAEEHGFFVAYPAQTKAANASKCWNWFSKTDQQRDLGEPSLIAGITREVMQSFPVDPGRVYVAGLSAGGAAAAIMGSAYPDLYAAVAVHSGLACGAAHDMASAFKAMRQGGKSIQRPARRPQARIVPTIVFHGDRDKTVSPINADQVIAQSGSACDLHTSVSRSASRDGIRYTRTSYADANGRSLLEKWELHGMGHAWSGGSTAGTYTEPRGPDASREIVRFFLQHRHVSFF